MNHVLPATLLALTLPLLAGCGSIVGAAIPPQTLSNPANLNGATLTSTSPLVVQRVGTSVQYDTSATVPAGSFDDLDLSEIPLGIRPYAAEIKASLKSVTVAGACVMPESFTLTLDTLAISVWNSGDKAGAATLSATPNVNVVATRTGGGVGTGTYSLAANSASVGKGDVNVPKALSILTSGGKNDVSVSAKISADNDGLAGCNLTFTLGDSSVTLSNFK